MTNRMFGIDSTMLVSVVCLLMLAVADWNNSMIESKEVVQPLTEQFQHQQSALLRSRKRISPHRSSSVFSHNDAVPQSPSPSLLDRSDRSMTLLMDDSEMHQDFINDKVKVTLDCQPDQMKVNLNFTEPFRGVVSVGKSAHNNSNLRNQCSIRGNGSRNYQLQVSHSKCFTIFDSKRGQFTNSLFVRYHPSLETGGDYSKTLICKFALTNINVN